MHIPHATHTAYTTGFYPDSSRDYAVRILLGACSSGAADAGEVLATVADVAARHDADWFAAWTAVGRRLAASGRDAAAQSRSATAARQSLRAATYLAQAVDAADDDTRATVFAEHRAAWEVFVDHGPFEADRIAVACDDLTLPVWILRPDAPNGRTLIMVNGSDGPISGMWSNGACGALSRGYTVVMFDGPGQQSMLFDEGTGFRHDFEAVLTPLLNAVLARPGVDPDRVCVYGVSQAGYWVPRALAFEHRFAAAIVDPGVVDVSASWLAHIPPRLQRMLVEGRDADFDTNMTIGLRFSPAARALWEFRARPYRCDGYAETMRAVERYRLTADLCSAVTTPVLITSPDHEQFWPGQSARLAELLGDRATLVEFTAAEGASWHCQPMARALTDERMFDWLDDRLGSN